MEIMVLTLATQAQPEDGCIFLGPHYQVSREDCFDEELQKLIARLIDELVLPFHCMGLTEKERSCIRGLLFFSPGKGDSSSKRERKTEEKRERERGEETKLTETNFRYIVQL